MSDKFIAVMDNDYYDKESLKEYVCDLIDDMDSERIEADVNVNGLADTVELYAEGVDTE